MSLKATRADDILRFDPALEEEIEPESPYRRYIVAMIGLLLLVLTVSWVFSDVLENRIEGKRAKEEVVTFGNFSVVLKNDVLGRLQGEFLAHQDREIKACLFGTVDGAQYIIDKVSFPDVLEANVVHVVSVPCPSGVLIDLHSHPIDQCLASGQDISVLRELQLQDQRIRMFIMCGQDRFAQVS